MKYQIYQAAEAAVAAHLATCAVCRTGECRDGFVLLQAESVVFEAWLAVDPAAAGAYVAAQAAAADRPGAR